MNIQAHDPEGSLGSPTQNPSMSMSGCRICSQPTDGLQSSPQPLYHLRTSSVLLPVIHIFPERSSYAGAEAQRDGPKSPFRQVAEPHHSPSPRTLPLFPLHYSPHSTHLSIGLLRCSVFRNTAHAETCKYLSSPPNRLTLPQAPDSSVQLSVHSCSGSCFLCPLLLP